MAFSSLSVVSVIGLCIYFVLNTIYRLTLHPLAAYPGPLLWRISGWPDGIAAKSGRRHLIHHHLHQKYGHVVRIAPNRLSFDTAKAFHDIHTNRNANVVKSGFAGFARDINHSPSLQQVADNYEHAQRRKIIAHAFSETSLRSAEDFMLSQINNWTTTIIRGAADSDDGWSETRDLGRWTNLLTLDVFGELCFGHNFHATDAGQNSIAEFVINTSKMGQTLSYLPIAAIMIPIFRSKTLLKLLSPSAYRDRWALRGELEGLILKRQQLEVDAEMNDLVMRKDFFHYVLKGRDDDGNMLPLQAYASEAVLLVGAGTDTTSTAISAALFHLKRNPEKLAKLRAEIDRAFVIIDEIHTGQTLSNLTYLRACIEETLRIVPPVPGSLTRKILSGGAMIDGISLPPGVDVGVPIRSLHYNEDYFPSPSEFLPERWIIGSKVADFEVTEELLAKQRNAFVPFSTGPRNCLGLRMAYMELGLVLTRLLFLFDMRFDHTKQSTAHHFETKDWFITEKSGPYLQFKPRRATRFVQKT